jgi:hypothetical protein
MDETDFWKGRVGDWFSCESYWHDACQVFWETGEISVIHWLSMIFLSKIFRDEISGL